MSDKKPKAKSPRGESKVRQHYTLATTGKLPGASALRKPVKKSVKK
jgi:hypothetical protein